MKLKRDFGHIGRTQRAVIDDLLVHGLSERETLEKHKVSPSRYRRWLENGVFRRELDIGIESASRQAKLTAALSLPKASARLAELINSEKDETARKACLDIIKLQKTDEEAQAARKAEQDEDQNEFADMSDAKASKILAILAEDDDEPKTKTVGAAQISVGAVREPPTSNDELQSNVGADPCVCPPPGGHVPTDTAPSSPDAYMSYSERIEKYGLPQPEGWQPPKSLPRAQRGVDGMGGMAISERSERGHVTTTDARVDSSAVHADSVANPEKQAALQRHREAAISIERATQNRSLLARPPRGIDLSAQKQNNFVIRSY